MLIVGAGGFIGGFIAERALAEGYETYVAVRKSTSRRYLSDPRLHFVVLDYDNAQQMREVLAQEAPSARGWDCIIWNLGATKCIDPADFDRINYGYLRDFCKALRALNMRPERFLFMSSLSALGPGDEKGYAPLTSATEPRPNTKYGLSKIKAEMCLEAQPELPWTVFRPTGVYGPHEKDYLMMIQSIDRGIDVSMGLRRQMLTFIYVDDLVDAMFKCLAAPAQKVVHKKYIISEDRAYTQAEFRTMVAEALGKRVVVPVVLPMWMVYGVSVVAEKVAAMRGKTSTLNRDKYRIMAQRNWSCDITDAQRDFGFRVQWPLERGVRSTVAAYLQG